MLPAFLGPLTPLVLLLVPLAILGAIVYAIYRVLT